ncbi:MAG: Gldg family protein [Eubacteriales bacterium]
MQKLPKSVRTGHQIRLGTLSLLTATLAIVLAVLVYLLIGLLPASIRKSDLTTKKVTELSDVSKDYLTSVEEDITVRLVAVAGQEDPTLMSFLERVDECSDRLNVLTVDPAVHPGVIANYSDTDLPDNSLIVSSDKRYKVLMNYDLYLFSVYDEQNQTSLGEYTYSDFYTLLTNYSAYFTAGLYSYEQLFSGENAIVSAVDYVTSDSLPTVYTLGSHGEYELPDGLLSALSMDNMEVKELTLGASASVPEDADCILIHAPATDLSDRELELLSDYLEKGGNLMLITDYRAVELDNLSRLLSNYGLSGSYGYLYESNADSYLSYEDLILANTDSAASYLGLGSYAAAFVDAHPIFFPEDSEEIPDRPIAYVSLFRTSESGRLHLLAEGETSGDGTGSTDSTDSTDGTGCYNMGVLATTDSSHIVWISSSYFLSSEINSTVAGGNYVYIVALLEKICNKPDSLSIASKAMVEDSLVINTAQAIFWTVILVVLVPIAVFVIGIAVNLKRRHRS